MKTAIVTGASGFIGSWLTQELLQNDYSVIVIARDAKRLIPEITKKCYIIEKSLEELKISDFKGKTADIFYHLAWSGVAAELKNKFDIQLDNIKNTLNVLEIAKGIGCGLFIATGTVAEYALSDNIMDMTVRQTPNDFYGAAKVSAYYFAKVKSKQLGQPFTWCVIPSTFGERRGDSNIITYTIKTLLKGEKPVYGNLQQMWDFLYVKDVVYSLRLVGEKGAINKIYGIGSGDFKTLKEYICRVRDVINPNLPLGIGENPSLSDSTFSSCVNTYDLKKDTGFQPKFSFEEAIAKTVEFYRGEL